MSERLLIRFARHQPSGWSDDHPYLYQELREKHAAPSIVVRDCLDRDLRRVPGLGYPYLVMDEQQLEMFNLLLQRFDRILEALEDMMNSLERIAEAAEEDVDAQEGE